jgi:hypothetical protein
MHKPMTLPSHEYRDKFPRTGGGLPHPVGGSVVVRGTDTGFTGWLRRGALAKYSRLVLSVLDGLRAAGYCVGTCRPRNFQGLGAARGATRPLRRHAGDCLCRDLHDVADMAILSSAYE